MPVIEVGGDADEGLRQVVDGVLDQRGMEYLQDAPAGDDAAIAEVEIEQPTEAHLREPAGPGLELRQMAAEIDGADHRAHRAPPHHVAATAFPPDHAQNPDI